MGKARRSLATSEIAWEDKTNWLASNVPNIQDSLKWDLIDNDTNLIEKNGRIQVPSLQQCCRTNDYFKHLKIIDEPLNKKFSDFEEMIKDIPESDDPYYLRQFRARRKAEKAMKKGL